MMRGDLDVIDTNGDVVDFVTKSNRNGRRAPEPLSFIHLQPDHAASLLAIKEAMWHDAIFGDNGKEPSDETVRSMIYRARTPIGRDLAIGKHNDKWLLDPNYVTTDVALLQHRAEHTEHNPASWPHLADQLENIKGIPFKGSRS